MTNYKDTFQIEYSKKSKTSISSESSVDSEKMDLKLENIRVETNQKILSKRNSIESPKIEKSSINENNHQKLAQTCASAVEMNISNSFINQTDQEKQNTSGSNENNIRNSAKSAKSKMISSKFKQISNFNESFQHNIIKIRRVFDGETLRIKQMPLNIESRMNHSKRYINRRIKLAQNAAETVC